MENILNKALSEVLTPRWSEELRGAFDTGYTFSDEFELRMRDLVRKTDRPVRRYVGYFTAAAAAVIAIVAAVTVPAIVRNSIDTEPPEQTTATFTADTATTSQTIVTTSVSESSVTVSETTTTSVTEPTSESSEPDVTEPAETAADTTTVTTTAETEITEDEIDDEPATVTDDAVIVDSDNEDDICVVDDSEDDDDAINDEPSDDVVKIKDGEPLEPKDGETLSELLTEHFPDVSFDDLWALDGFYYPDDDNTKYIYPIDPKQAEFEFLHDFVHKLGDAKYVADTEKLENMHSTEHINVTVTDAKPVIYSFAPFNSSPWSNYSYFFGVENGQDVVDDDEEDMEEELSIAFAVEIYRVPAENIGIVRIQSVDHVGEDNHWERYNMSGSSAMFTIDASLTDELFEHFGKMLMPDNARTLGDINDKMNIASDNIYRAYADVSEVYDTRVFWAGISSSYLEELFTRYKDRTVTMCQGPEAVKEEYLQGAVEFRIYLKNSAFVQVFLTTNGLCLVNDGYRAYCFNYDDGELQRAIKAFSDANGYDIELYDTLGEYLDGKNFTKLKCVRTWTITDGKHNELTVSDKKELAELQKLLAELFEDAEYVTDTSDIDITYGDDPDTIEVEVNGYNTIIYILSNDVVYIRTYNGNVFRLPEGSFAKISEAIKSCENAKFNINDPDIDDDRHDTVIPIDDYEIDD